MFLVGKVRTSFTMKCRHTFHSYPDRKLVLGIETSCDDTACAVVSTSREILGECIERQDHVHGVVKGITPFVASGLHKENIDKAVQGAMEKAGVNFKDLEAIAVTRGPGLGLCLEVGIVKAKALALEHNLPVIAVNHMEGHALISRFCGHTMILVCLDVGEYMQLGTTLDDSIGEAFDKVARDLNLDWEGGGGKSIEKMAKQGISGAFTLKEPMKGIKDCNFSFSGIKSQVRRGIDAFLADGRAEKTLSQQEVADISLAFQDIATKHLTTRLARAIEWCNLNLECAKDIKHIVISGGVASNLAIRERIGDLASGNGLELVCPPPRLCTDNGVMIAWAGIENMMAKKSVFSSIEAQSLLYEPRWPLDPSRKNYFPQQKKVLPQKTSKAELRLQRDIANCMELIQQQKFEEVSFVKAIRNAITLNRLEEAQMMCKTGLDFSPENKTLVKLMYKTQSRIQTAQFHNTNQE